MILTDINYLIRYYSLHPLIKEADEFFKSYQFINPGERLYVIEDKLFIIPSLDNAKSKEKAFLEAHNRYIDIQVCLEGKETFGWKNRSECHLPQSDFNDEKDIIFYDDKPDFYFDLHPGQLAIFFPEDCHAPMIGDGKIKKVIFKVEV